MGKESSIEKFRRIYTSELYKIGTNGLSQFLDNAKNKYNLTEILKSGGFLTFPHIWTEICGEQVAAVVNACLDYATDKILFIGVFHAANEAMQKAKIRYYTQGCDTLQNEPLQCLYGIEPHNNNLWKLDHCTIAFEKLLEIESKRRKIKMPKITKVFPFLIGSSPSKMRGFDKLKKLTEDSIIISTADICHHGRGYNNRPQNKLSSIYKPDTAGLKTMKNIVKDGLDLLLNAKYSEYQKHCMEFAGSDWGDAGTLAHYLTSPNRYEILEFGYGDYSYDEVYNSPPPNWVVSALVEWV